MVRTPAPPPRPPWVKADPTLPEVEVGAWVPGTLLDWRMVDVNARSWTGLVRFTAGGLVYELWLPNTEIKAADQ